MLKKEWDYTGLLESFQMNRNEEAAVHMAAYMRNQFAFLGIKTPLRNALLKEQFLKHHLPETKSLKEEIWKLYLLPEREYQYAAVALLEKMKNQLSVADLPFLRKLIETKSWWDSVDSIAPRIVGGLVLAERIGGSAVMLEWAQAQDMWTNRAAILHQLKFKRHTDTAVLSQIILTHSGSPEFFIQKSIGWALREYAKTDPDWVHSFTESNNLMPLSKREALKHIK